MPDALSRMPHACTISVISYSSLLQDIQTTQQRDPYTQQLISDLEMQRVAHGSPRMQQCLLMVHGKWFVPNIREINTLILQEAHDCKMAWHDGIHQTLPNIQHHLFWPHKELDVKDYAQSCVTCQQVKAWHGQPYGLLQPMPIPGQPWDVVSMDFIVNFPVSRGYNSSMVIINYFSKQAHIVPTKLPLISVQVAKMFFKHIFKYHGMLAAIISNRDGSIKPIPTSPIHHNK